MSAREKLAGGVSAEGAPALAAGPTQAATTPAEDSLPDVDQLDRRALRVIAKQPERRRAGFLFTPKPAVLAPAMVDFDRLLALIADPLLIVEITIDGNSWRVMNADELALIGEVGVFEASD